jgi:hypothetical protein
MRYDARHYVYTMKRGLLNVLTILSLLALVAPGPSVGSA